MRFFNLKKRNCGNNINPTPAFVYETNKNKYNKHRCSVIEVNTRSAHLFDKGISFSLSLETLKR